MEKKILIICFSYPPETGASSGRIFNLACMLRDRGDEVTVMAAMPNYPTGKIFKRYRYKIYHKEIHHGIKVIRTGLIPSNSRNPIRRVLSLLSYSLFLFMAAVPRIISRKTDIIIVNSPSFATGLCGSIIARLSKAKILLNVSDLWPLSVLELGVVREGWFYNFLLFIEKRMYRGADAIMGQSQEILDYIGRIVPTKKYFLYYNIQSTSVVSTISRAKGKRKIVYTGLLGVAQGLSEICFGIEFGLLDTELHIYGNGSEKKKIEEYIIQHPDCGIYYHGMVASDQVPELLKQYHAMLIPLKTNIYGAVPSKIFSAIANGLPILFSGNGEGSAIVEQNKLGLTNKAGDYKALAYNIQRIVQMDEEEYNQLCSNCLETSAGTFNIEKQNNDFCHFLYDI